MSRSIRARPSSSAIRVQVHQVEQSQNTRTPYPEYQAAHLRRAAFAMRRPKCVTSAQSMYLDLSTQDTAYQKEAKPRLHLPYELLSDENLQFANAVKLPTFTWENKTLIKRCGLVIKDESVIKVWYPAFPPERRSGVARRQKIVYADTILVPLKQVGTTFRGAP